MKNHEKAFSDIKNYYNDITLNNLALINSLKVNLVLFLAEVFKTTLYVGSNRNYEEGAREAGKIAYLKLRQKKEDY